MSDMDFDVTSADGVTETANLGSERVPEVVPKAEPEKVPAEAKTEADADAPKVEVQTETQVEEKPEADGDPEPKQEVAPEPKKAKGIEPWMQRRLDEQTAKQREAERKAQEAQRANEILQATIDRLRKGEAEEPSEAKTPAIPEGYIKASDIKAEAARIAREEAFNDRANQAYADGKKAFADFDQALQPLNAMGALQRFDFQEAALATDAAPEVLHYLGSNPEEASKILDNLKSGSNAKAVAAMTKIATKIAAEKAAAVRKATSKVPAPITPVGGSAVPIVDLEKVGMDQFSDSFDKKARSMGWY